MREPSIHITRKALRLILHEYFKEHKIGKPVESLVEYLLKRGVNYALSNRSHLAAVPDKQERRINRVVSSRTEDALMFAKILHLVRLQMKHRGITPYTKAHRDWEFIVELSGLATEFCHSFNLKRDEGYQEYIKLALGISKAFKLRQVKAYHETIIRKFEATIKIRKDPNKEYTERAYHEYRRLVYEATGINHDYRAVPEKYVCFVEVSKLCREMQVKPEHFVIGNFETLASFSTGIPAPEQLITNNGIERVIKWKAENRESIKKEVDTSIIEEFKKRQAKHRKDDTDSY